MLSFSDSSGITLDVSSRLKAICSSTYSHLHSTHSTPASPSTHHPPSPLVHLSSHALVGPSMCATLFRLNANRRSQIKKMVLEQHAIIDFSCTLPVGWHPYYTDKRSKSQVCVSTIKNSKKKKKTAPRYGPAANNRNRGWRTEGDTPVQMCEEEGCLCVFARKVKHFKSKMPLWSNVIHQSCRLCHILIKLEKKKKNPLICCTLCTLLKQRDAMSGAITFCYFRCSNSV